MLRFFFFLWNLPGKWIAFFTLRKFLCIISLIIQSGLHFSLIVENVFFSYVVQDGTLMGTALVTCFGAWFLISLLISTMTYILSTDVTSLYIFTTFVSFSCREKFFKYVFELTLAKFLKNLYFYFPFFTYYLRRIKVLENWQGFQIWSLLSII